MEEERRCEDRGNHSWRPRGRPPPSHTTKQVQAVGSESCPCRAIESGSMDFYAIKHTDGDINLILDQLIDANPHALHSLDPQGNVDIAVVKKHYGHRVCLIGNVNCALMDTGTDRQVVKSAEYALMNGMPGGGYIFSTSNCVYTGMRLARYELILDVWKRLGNYS